jgi:hypothetical protein
VPQLQLWAEDISGSEHALYLAEAAECKRVARAGLLRAIARMDGHSIGSAEAFVPPAATTVDAVEAELIGNPLSDFVLRHSACGAGGDGCARI